MIRISLSSEQRHALSRCRKDNRSQAAERCAYVLLADEGLSPPHIGQRLNRHEHTIRHWLKTYQAQGLSGLTGRRSPGRPGTQGAQTAALVEQALSQSPAHFGYIETDWTVDLLRHYFQRHHTHTVSDSTVRRMLKAGGWSYKRSRQTMPRHAPSGAQKKSVWHRSLPRSKPSTRPV